MNSHGSSAMSRGLSAGRTEYLGTLQALLVPLAQMQIPSGC